MLLQRLVEYVDGSSDVVPAFYERKPVRWVLDLDAHGQPATGLTDLAVPDDRERRFGVPRLVPKVSRTVNVSPALGVDTPEYVLGWVGDDGDAEAVAKRHQAFRDLMLQWTDAQPGDIAAAAIAAFYRTGGDKKVTVEGEWGRGDLIAFRVEGVFACDTPSAQRFWAEVASGRKGLGRTGLCLVHGGVGPLLKTVPQQVERRWLPGATNSAALVSINEAVHGYELEKFLGNTPICIDCGLKFMSGLTSLLSDPRHSRLVKGQDTRLVWWLTAGRDDDIMGMLDEPHEEQVGRLLAGVQRGAPAVAVPDVAYFCSVALAGNVARVVVRDWIEMPLPRLYENLQAWFADHQIVDGWTGQPVWFGLPRLITSSGRWRPGPGGAAGSWVPLGARGEDRPYDVDHALMRAALLKVAPPPRLAAHIIARIRADRRVDPPRVALLRLWLRRNPYPTDPERFTPMLNPDNRDPAYVSGRIFAALEALQESFARVGQQNLNTTFADRHLARAITAPRTAIIAGQRTATAWVKRISRTNPGLAHIHKSRLDDLFSLLDSPSQIPAAAPVRQQAEFILGYHHQRAAIHAERAARADQPKKAAPQTGTEPDAQPENDTRS